jgi:hypothetical protein
MHSFAQKFVPYRMWRDYRIPDQSAAIQWAVQEYAKFEDVVPNELSRIANGNDPEWFVVRHGIRAPFHRAEQADLYREMFRRIALAAGWNHIDWETGESAIRLTLWSRVEPISVLTLSGESFTPEFAASESFEAAIRRISTEGAWQYTSAGMRAFIPPHQIASIQVHPALPATS